MYPYLYSSDNLTIGSYGFFLAMAYLVGRWYFLKIINQELKPDRNIEPLIILLLLLGVIGAKIMFLLKNPGSLDLLFSGKGFSSQGALIGALIATFLFSRITQIKLSCILDSAAPAAILAYGIARIGCFMSGDDCHGLPTDLPWGMSFPNGIEPTDENVHPVPLYELLYSISIFSLLWFRRNASSIPYRQFFLLLFLWGSCRFIVEFISTNPKIILGMSGSQFGAAIMATGATIFFIWHKVSSLNKEKPAY
ncbi:MAG: prolipoprotein diacylglyceryl transferase [Kangiellaceae bacterium]|nr:prolipoprotein diacylglyceryl transferase [Kangiellaceae bacterium]